MSIRVGAVLEALNQSDQWGALDITTDFIGDAVLGTTIKTQYLGPGRERELVIPMEFGIEGWTCPDGWPVLADDSGGVIWPIANILLDRPVTE